VIGGPRTTKRRQLTSRSLPAASVIAMLALAVSASAYWTDQGSGSANGIVGSLQPPTISKATPGAGSVSLSWSTVTSPGSGQVSYYLTRDGGTPAGDCPTSAAPTTQTSCTDSGVAVGSHEYTVTAVWRSWTAKSETSTVQVASPTATHLVLSAASTTPTAGVGDNLTITAQDASNKTVTGYTGAKSLAFGGASTIGANHPAVTNSSGTAVNFGAATTIAFTNGVASVSGTANGAMTLYKAETTSITVSDGSISNGAGLSVTVKPATASSFALPTPATQTAGTAFNETLTAQDAFGNTATGYTAAKTIAFSGPAASPSGKAPTYPASVTFTAGVGTASVTLFDAQSTALSAKEGTLSGSTASFTVNPGAASNLAWSSPSTSAPSLSSPCLFTCNATGQTHGTTFTAFVAVTDSNGNIETGVGDTVTLSAALGSFNRTSLTIPASGPAISSQSTTFTAPSTSKGTVTVTAGDGGAHTAAIANVGF
jgi:hypothetical protein